MVGKSKSKAALDSGVLKGWKQIGAFLGQLRLWSVRLQRACPFAAKVDL